MKTIKSIIIILLGQLLFFSCKKEIPRLGTTASLTIINASQAVPEIVGNFAPKGIPYYEDALSISYGSSLEYGLPTGSNYLNLLSSTDSTQLLFHGSVNLKAGGIYSLYVFGNALSIDTLFTSDQIPIHQDSVAGARLINLSPDSGPLNVSLQGSSQNEFNNVSFKSITSFTTLPVNPTITNSGGYNFQVTNNSGTVLATLNWNPTVFKNYTFVIAGSETASSIKLFAVNNF